MVKKSLKIPSELKRFEDVAGEFIQYWGFKKIHGRIWAHLFTASKPLDSQELMKRLKVSKGLVSLAVRDLLRHEVILESHTGKHGTVYYGTNPDLMGVITNVLRQRESAILTGAGSAVSGLLKMSSADLEKNDLSQEKIHIVSNLISSAHGLLSVFLMSVSEEEQFNVLNRKEIQ
jgi:DNA-binding transcriptional regulator GbsR (MarR family)